MPVTWLLGLEELVGQAIAQAAWTTPYSLSQDYISDLGVTRCGTYRILGETSYICSPLHDVMNVSFVLAGLFMVVSVPRMSSTALSSRVALSAVQP
jgi:hypothetical protein